MNENDDKTRVLPADAAVLAATANPRSATLLEEGASALPAGTVLHEYEIVSTIGQGGFGIVYLADDSQLDGRVAIKEYMPSALASRSSGLDVSVRSPRHQETFEAGRRSFVNEAKALRRFDHPSLAKVYRFWEANGTAYMVMPFYEGVTFKELLHVRGVPDEAWLREFLRQLLEALAIVHRSNWYHRDIAPDNILMLADDRPLLLDFGAARRVIGDMTQALTVILKPGFAPLEQYGEIPGMRQGPWTDLYALAAVVHYAIVGKVPVPSVSRMVTDSLKPLAQFAAGRYSDAFLRAIDHALVVRPEARTQSVEQFANELGLPRLTTAPLGRFLSESKAPAGIAPGERALKAAQSVEQSMPQSAADVRPADPVAALRSPGSSKSTTQKREARTSRVRPLSMVLSGLAAITLAAGGWLYVERRATPETKSTTSSGVSTSIASESGKAFPSTKVAKRAPDALDPLLAPVPSPTIAGNTAPGKPSGPETDGFDPTQLLNALHAGADSEQHIEVSTELSTARIGKDELRFRIHSELSGYHYVFMIGARGTSVSQLFPNALDRNNRMAEGSDFVLPRAGWTMVAGGPPGVDRFVAIVSAAPRDFASAGLRPGNPYSEFDLTAARRAMASGGTAALAGRPDCSKFSGTAACNIYTAARFEITETP